jgi:hypothetical protein
MIQKGEANLVISPCFGRDCRLRIVVDDPATAIDGTVLEGFVYLDGSVPTIIHDRSGRPDVYPWPLLAGPVLRIYELAPRRKPLVVYAQRRPGRSCPASAGSSPDGDRQPSR